MSDKLRALSNREIASFCSQMAMLQQAGITPLESMELLIADVRSSEAKKLYQRIYEICSKGEPFYEGISQTGVFPEYVLHMVRMGEEAGELDRIMMNLSSYYERQEEIRENIHNAVSYPLVMIGMMFLVIIVLITKVLPIFEQVFLQLGTEMNAFSSSLLILGRKITSGSAILLVLLAFLVCGYLYAANTVSGSRLFKKIFSRFRFVRELYDGIAISRFSSGMALTLSSGMDTYHSLDLVTQLVEEESMRIRIDNCKERLLSGASFAEAVAAAGIFNHFYSKMIDVGFRTGSVDQVLEKIADDYDAKTTAKLSNIISILEPTLVIILSMIVGLILLSVILPLMGIMSSIG